MGMLDIIKGHPPRKNMKFDGFVAAPYLPPSFIFWLTGWNFFTISIYPHLYKYIIVDLFCDNRLLSNLTSKVKPWDVRCSEKFISSKAYLYNGMFIDDLVR
jgi:hypothetical protein